MRIYRVTEVLQPYNKYGNVPPDVLAKAADRGTEVHEACNTVAEGIFSYPGVHIEGYVHSFRAWFDKNVMEVIEIEPEWIHEPFGFKGHPDYVLWLKDERGSNYRMKKAIVDLKTPVTAYKTWAGQLCAYWLLGEKNGHPDIERVGSLRLDPDGGPAKMKWYEGDRQLYVTGFLNALAACRTFL